jgi:pleiotropic regulator 1
MDLLLSASRKQTAAVFGDEYLSSIDITDEISHRAKISSKIRSEYESVKELPFFLAEKQGKQKLRATKPPETDGLIQTKLIEDVQRSQRQFPTNSQIDENSQSDHSQALTVSMPTSRPQGTGRTTVSGQSSSSLIRRENYQPVKPEWHAPWKLRTVLRYALTPSLFRIERH